MICPECRYECENDCIKCPECGHKFVNTDRGVIINGKKLVCSVCGGDSFLIQKSLLNTRALSFFDLDWANGSATNYICDDCGYIFWFMDTPKQYIERLLKERQMQKENQKFEIDYETSEATEDECPNCFGKIKAEDQECARCGHKLR